VVKTNDGVPPAGHITVSRDWIWPVALAIALAVVLVVNGIFIYIAVTGADEVAPSYVEGER
jgi:hypothetical protein